LATIKRLKADASSVSPSSEQIGELWVALGLYSVWEVMELHYWWEQGIKGEVDPGLPSIFLFSNSV